MACYFSSDEDDSSHPLHATRASYPVPIYMEGEDDELVLLNDANTRRPPTSKSRGRGNPSNNRGRGGRNGRGGGRGISQDQANEHSDIVPQGGRGGRGNRGKGENKNRGRSAGGNTNESRGRGGRGGRGRDRPSSGSNRGRSESGQSSAANSRSDQTDGNRGRRDSVSGEQTNRLNRDSSKDGRKREARKPFISFQKLVTLSKYDDPDKLLFEISNEQSGLRELLEQSINPRSVYHLVRMLTVAIKSTQMRTRRELLQLVEAQLLSKWSEFLNDVSMQSAETAPLHSRLDDLSKVCIWIMDILKAVMEALHSSLGKCKSVITALREVQEMFPFDSVDTEFATEMAGLQEYLYEVMRAKEKQAQDLARGNQRKDNRNKNREPQLPPEDFREINVLPRTKDFALDEKPFLRANKAEGKYDSLDMYLDIQFRLLREDYINPLRAGITEYRSAIKAGASVKKFREIRLYNSVQIIRPVCSVKGIEYVIQFDVSNFKSMNWAISRRLMHGSLLCLSKDDFETMFYATVTERDDKDLNDGFLQVHFEDESIPDIAPNEKFIMAETTAYFEAYRHILDGLKDMTATMPLQQYLIECKTDLKPPKYLLHAGGPRYNFKSILIGKKRVDKAVYPVLNTMRWPDESELGFDTSQLEAMKQAITKELAIIQGPPGTGKTYVGLQITKLLMANEHVWNQTKAPILVVCYTNHALDQFLEGILSFCEKGIVRVGGRCSNEQLEPFVLKNLKKQKREDRSRAWGILQSERDCRKLLRESEIEITRISTKLKKTTTRLVSFNKLENCMTDEQQYSLMNKLQAEDEKNYISIWLQMDLGPTPEQSEQNMSTAEEMKLFWQSYILENVSQMSEGDQLKIENIWELDLLQRAKLYKLWVSQYISELERRKQRCKIQAVDDEGKLANILKRLEKTIALAFFEILGTSSALSNVISYPCTVQQMTQGAMIHSDTAMYEWLCLDGTEKSTSAIPLAVDNNTDTDHTESADLDLEEDRRIDDDDDDDDDFLHDFSAAKPKLKKKQKPNNDGWLLQWNEKKFVRKLKHMLSTADDMTPEDAASISNVWRIPLEKKRALYKYWVSLYRQVLKSAVREYEESYNEATERLREVRDQETVEIIREAKFVGMTTTGAAKNRQILQRVRPRIVIVEEAAEVLESHIVTTLNEDCQHLILIGDHKQLRPSTTVYDLSKKYHLDISLFERMIKNGVPCVTLSQQHRMRPEISVLMRYHNLYPNLQDHPCVREYYKVLGLDTNIQFINHDKEEARSAESTSYSNPHEAKFLASFCRYLLNQGYTADQITVITPYMGQVILLRKEMPKANFGVRITAVDNFQGEENDIILLSLVRSSSPSKFSQRNPIGFLGIENRICVALSRAKMGFYVIGNFTLLQEHSTMWQYMADQMMSRGCLRAAVTLRCQIHPQSAVNVETPNDFRKSPEGGCEKSCSFRLECGHFCPRACHVLDKEHKYSKCIKPCTKKACNLGHPCKKKCFQECGKCNEKIEKIIPMCGHREKMECHRDPYTVDCKVVCESVLPCGHRCGRQCSTCTKENKHKAKCQEAVSRELKCGHTAKLLCFEDPEVKPCPEPCTVELDCKHKCKGSCGGCFRGKLHMGCKETCKKNLPCGHKCNFPCSDICPPCNIKCEWTCSHGKKCQKLCSEECEKCAEGCRYRCDCSKQCEKRCDEECDTTIVCNEPCRRKSKCGKEDHLCIGICGEKCIPFCKECDAEAMQRKCDESVKSDGGTAIVLPDCGCILSVQRMDRIMKEIPGTRDDIFKSCPKCKKPIRRDIKRYSTILKQCRKDILQRYRQLKGTDQERKEKVITLTKSIVNLRSVGLDAAYVAVLRHKLSNDTFGVLHRMDQTVSAMSDLLEASTRLEKLEENKVVAKSDMKDILQPKELKAILLRDQKYTTKQFWGEIRREVNRLDLIAKLCDLKHTKFRHGFDAYGDSALEMLLTRGLTILYSGLPFDEKRQDTILRVYSRLENA